MSLIFRISLFLVFLVFPAFSQVTLGLSNQNFGLTGIGPNSSGQGQSRMSWGSCNFDGTNTNCVVSGNYTYAGSAAALGSAGTYSFQVSYPGTGTFPLIAVTNPGSDLFFAQATSNFSFVITLTPTSGPPVNFYSFANFSFTYSNPTCSGSAVSLCSVGHVGQIAGAFINGPVIGVFDPTPMIRTNLGVISASGYGAFTSIAPATWVEIYGINLATTLSRTWAASDFSNNTAPTSLAGTSVTVAGRKAYVEYVAPGQINAQVPTDTSNGPQPVVVTTAGGTSLSFTVNVNFVEPGLLAIPAFIYNGNQNVVALFSNTLTFVFPVPINGASARAARPGDIITLYGIGFGAVTPAIPAGQVVTQANNLAGQVSVMIGGVPANVTFAGQVASDVGLYQFNVVVPNVPANNATPLVFSLNGTPGTQNLVLAISN